VEQEVRHNITKLVNLVAQAAAVVMVNLVAVE
jgi:hypothetical protein